MNIENLYKGITNNKIYIDLKNYDTNDDTNDDINNNNNNDNTINNYDNIFTDMSLNYIINNKNKELETNCDLFNIYKKTNKNIDTQNHISHKFIENSFLKELTNITFLELSEIKENIKNYVNLTSTNDYLKTLSRSYKKLRIDINNVLVKNLDNNLFNELFNIFCKVFNFNIIIINEKKKIYIMFILDEDLDYYLFNEIENDKNKNYKFKEVLKKQNIINILQNYNKKLELNKIKQLKVEQLKKLAKEYKVNINQKKDDLINDLSKFI